MDILRQIAAMFPIGHKELLKLFLIGHAGDTAKSAIPIKTSGACYSEDDYLQKKDPYADYYFIDVALGRN